MKTKYVRLPSGSIVEYTPVYVVGDNGEEVQVTLVVGEESTKSAFEKQQVDQEAKREKEKLAAQAEAAMPKEITMRQARLALLGAGLLTQVGTAIAGMSSPQKEAAQIEWEYSNSLRRAQPLVVQLGAVLGLTSARLDDLFVTASKL